MRNKRKERASKKSIIPIIKNSGGCISTWKNNLAEEGGNILATSNKKLHRKILKIINPIIKNIK